MRNNFLRATAVAASVALHLVLLCSCGSLDEERKAGNGSSTGVIAAFGSVTVNGIRYTSVGSPSIRFGTDAPGAAGRSENDLRIGMNIRVSGSFDRFGRTGSYDGIVFFSEVSGPIDNASVDPATNRFRVLEKIVVVDASTVFDNNTGLRGTSPLASGDMVQVSGFFTNGGMGTILATRVARIPSTDPAEIKGLASNAAGGGFQIGGITVTTSGATRLPNGFPASGDNVYVAGNASGATIAASLVEKLSAFGSATSGGRISVDGIVLGPPAGGVFTLFGSNGPVPVRIDAATSFTGGSSGNVSSGARLEAEGTLDGAGTMLQAASITFIRQNSNAILEGTVTAKTSNTLTVLGKTVSFTTFTLFFDRTGTGRPFGFANIVVGNRVRAGGFFDNAAQSIEAALLERKTQPDSASTGVIQGIVTASDAALRTLEIMGINVQTSPGFTTYRLLNGTTAATDADFFAAVFPGTTSVIATGIFQAPSTFNPTDEAEIVP